MQIKDAYELGYERGYNCASWQEIPEIGARLDPSVDWNGIDTIEDADDQREAFEMLCGEAESHDRQYTPFEFTAKAFNDEENSEDLWEAFDEGITDGIRAYMATLTFENATEEN